jgi:putative salt-induced outer membrane protein YdiY
MFRRLPVIAIAAFALAAAVTPDDALADEVILTNGDRLTGKITRAGDGQLTIDSPYFGTVTTALSNVQGFVIDPAPTTGPTRLATTPPATAPATTSVASTAPVAPPAKPPVKRWSGSVVAGLAVARGNTNSEGWKITADATRKGDNNTLTLSGGYAYEQQKDRATGTRNTTVDNWFGQARLEHNLTERFYDYALVRVEQDNVANLQLRVSPGVGAGYRWILKPNEHFNTEAGVSWVYEQYTSGGNNDHVALRLAYHYDRKLNDKVSLVHNVEYLPNVADWGDYNLNADVGLRAMLVGTLFAEFKVVWQRDSTPAPGALEDDLRYTVGMGFNF